jgi:hypothetical protein
MGFSGCLADWLLWAFQAVFHDWIFYVVLAVVWINLYFG